MTASRPHVTGITVLVVLLLAAPASAYSPPTARTYKRDVPGGKYVFVMIPGKREFFRSESPMIWGETAAADMQEIRRVYGVSGLYPTDGTKQPLWTVDWYAFDVEVASDGVHLVRLGRSPFLSSGDAPPTEKDLATEAVTFFASGRPVRTYTIGELVDSPSSLPRLSPHFQWRSGATFDDERMEYRLTTHDGNRFVFDVRTGEIISQSRPGLWAWWVIGGGATVTAIAGLCVWLGRWARLSRRG
jgi:hypothetical protein